MNSSSITASSVTLTNTGNKAEVEGFTASLVITSFKEVDKGTYTFRVCNSIGCESSDVNLKAAGMLN